MTQQSAAFEGLGDRLTRLARVTASLVRAADLDAVTKIVVQESADAVGATIASLSVRDGDQVRLMGLRGGLEGDEQQYSSYPLTVATPATQVLRSGERLLLSGRREILEHYPDMPWADRGERSIVCLPLSVSSGTIGAIGLSFPGHRVLDDAELDFFEILADTCAQALVRIRAEAEAAERQAKLTFLADASAELASSLDYEATLAQVARLAVPTFADWSAIDLVRDGRLHRLAVAHFDPAKVQLAQELAERYPSDPDAPAGPWNVMRTRKSELLAEITDDMLVAGARDEELLRIARDLNLRSSLTVPLIARDRLLGVMTWVAAESGRTYTADDVAFAEELAKRGAMAIDNSELHSETLAAARRLQHAVLPDHMPRVPGCDIAALYSPSGRTDIGGDFYDVIPLDDGRLALFVGDVMGRGVAAAAAMAQMRSAVRAYVALDPSPGVVVGRLDRMLLQYGGEQLVTLAYLLADTSEGLLTVTNAGHPPPVLLRRDGTGEQLENTDGSPLGVVPQRRGEHVVPFRPGDTLLVFTDGLIERRGEDIDVGQQRLLEALALLRQGDLDVALAQLVARVRDATRDDDVAALCLRLDGPER
ncbi:GAF domain-containing SpoIIE family protein phosphatase [Pedococcus sp. 5OH_020]|uniref:GAF domain-containing SpoIIE family protein phosphatase n=1 Tax=Pedococcus sp. 5OH_020 TaxID=2989814 RepID=UPI0022EA0D1F|nr:SpoIIE family protein phosphatase [Pedococcus sp. 5OH_020]